MSGKVPKRERKKFTVWFKELSKGKKAGFIIGIAVVVIFTAAVIYVASKFSKLNTEKISNDDILVNESIEEMDFGKGYTNFVLFGGDSRTGEVDKNLNTDAIIIVSLNNETKEIKLVSVYRDTLMDVTTGSLQKCNSAYSGGGATRAINMLNMNLDLNIKKYVTVDFGVVANVIDMLGGIEVDISEAEMNAMNKYIKETATVAGKEAVLIEEPGYQHLDGVQATTYARIRKGVGDDYKRTERQRLVIQLVLDKVLQSSWSTINNIIDEVLPSIATNLTSSEIIKYAKNFAYYDISDSTGFPFEKGSGTIPGKGSCVYAVTLESNVRELHEFLFGTQDYQPTSTVQSISAEIESLVGGGSWTDTDTTTDWYSSHTHSWIPVTETVHHDAIGHYEDVLVKEAYDEEVPVYETQQIIICSTCGQDITGDVDGHLSQTGHAGTRNSEVPVQTGTDIVPHKAEYASQWVEDVAAYDETIVTGYYCSCGATK